MSISALVTLMVICTIVAVGVVVVDLILVWPAVMDKAPVRTVSLMLFSALWLGAAIYWLRLLAIKLHALRRETR